jgi:hypothetical protein
VASDPEDVAEVDDEVSGSGEPRRTARRRTHERARRESKRHTHHGRCCHRRLNNGRRWSRNGRRLIGPRSRRQGGRGCGAGWRFSSPSLPGERGTRRGSMDRAAVDCTVGAEEAWGRRGRAGVAGD